MAAERPPSTGPLSEAMWILRRQHLPLRTVLNVEIVDFSTSVEMTVFDVQGRNVTPSAFGHSPLKKGGELLRWDVNGWASGIYILKGTDDVGRSFSIKFVKE